MTEPLARLIAALADHYLIERELGQGGMATVFLAQDLKHDRKVAIKVLREELAAALGRERFLREITTTAGLHHPHILPLYDSGATDDLLFYVMPYVEGESLRDRLDREKQLPLEDALAIAREVADALSYAHGHGIVHRDVKPANILLESGHAVVADFGIARAVQAAGGTHLTRTGMAIGTPAYMSPEQASGEGQVDGRSDIYALGCVLYEMLAGRPPFVGPTVESVVHQHLVVGAPPVTDLRPAVPANVSTALLRALAKNPADRYPTAERFAAALGSRGHEAALGGAGTRRTAAPALAAVLGLLLVGALSVLWWRGRPGGAEGPPAVSLRQLTHSPEVEEYPALSPDGTRLVFSRELGGQRQLFLVNIADGAETRLTSGSYDNIQASFTPDGGALLFVRASQAGVRLQPGDVFGAYSGGDIWRRDLATGAEERLVEGAFDPAMAPDGRRIAYYALRDGSRRIWVSDERGRNAQPVSSDSSEAVEHIMPSWSPDGRSISFQYVERTRFDIGVVDVATRAVTAVTKDGFRDLSPVWEPSGRALYFTSDRGAGLNVWRMPVTRKGAPQGPPTQVTTGAGQDVQLAVAASGRLAFTVLHINADLYRLPLDSATGRPRGEPEPLVATTREDSRGAWSPDGTRVAFNSDRGGDMNIWIHSLTDGTDRQVTRGPGGDYQPRWSPDGRTLVFFSARAGNADIWNVDVETGALSRLTDSPWLDINPAYAPDGGQIAFQSDRQGRIEIWRMNADGTGQQQLTRDGVTGHFLVWSADGSRLYFGHAIGTPPSPMLLRIADGVSEPVAVKGGAHMSFNPAGALIMDVVTHRELWVSPLRGAPYRVFAFKDPEVRIDYPVWSPDGRWLLFDRARSEGGDIWLIDPSGRVP